MARNAAAYLADLVESVEAVRAYTKKGKGAFLRSTMARDAVVARIIRIGEAVKGTQSAGMNLEAMAPEVPWAQVAGMRDILSHQYWRTDPAIVWAVVEKDLAPLEAAARRILRSTGRPGRKR